VTGGLGYIGSHTVVKLLNAGFPVVIFDNLSNSSRSVIDRIIKLAGKNLWFVEGDIRNHIELRKTFKDHSIGSVIHFAGLKAIGESEVQSLLYHDNNVAGSTTLFEEMERAGVQTIVFSSSAAVYGNPGYNKYREDTPLSPVNVYGRTKLMVEDILRNLINKNPSWRIGILRYFNPVGAHLSGMIGEDPLGIPNNLMPFIAQVAAGKQKILSVYGGDYATPDGTCRRDYIHVEDLAAAHLAALESLHSRTNSLITVNLGTGQTYSVLEVIHAFIKASGMEVPFQIVNRRMGDLAEYYADPTLAKNVLGWEAKLNIDRMCEDTWRWQKNNINGFQ
jgi:UDP-glucose 4-epimerase